MRSMRGGGGGRGEVRGMRGRPNPLLLSRLPLDTASLPLARARPAPPPQVQPHHHPLLHRSRRRAVPLGALLLPGGPGRDALPLAVLGGVAPGAQRAQRLWAQLCSLPVDWEDLGADHECVRWEKGWGGLVGGDERGVERGGRGGTWS